MYLLILKFECTGDVLSYEAAYVTLTVGVYGNITPSVSISGAKMPAPAGFLYRYADLGPKLSLTLQSLAITKYLRHLDTFVPASCVPLDVYLNHIFPCINSSLHDIFIAVKNRLILPVLVACLKHNMYNIG